MYYEDILDFNTWGNLSNLVVGFMEEFTNVTLRDPKDASWFQGFKFVAGKKHVLNYYMQVYFDLLIMC